MPLPNNKVVFVGPQATDSTITLNSYVGNAVNWFDTRGNLITMADYAWTNWVSTATTAGFSEPAWASWTAPNTQTLTFTQPPPPPVWTPEQIRQAEAARVAHQEQVRVRERLNQEADARAKLLMQKCLSPAEWDSYNKKGYIDITCPSGMVYRIERGSHGNVKEMVKGPDGKLRIVAKLCAQPDAIPLADVNLSQYLHLLHDEADFRRIANRTLWRTNEPLR
jgi:hypothetical protein